MRAQLGGSKSSFEDSPVEEEEEHVPFDTVPDANTRLDQGEKPENARPNPLTTTKSHISTRSQRSYAGADGYTRFSEENRVETSPVGKEGAESNQDGEIIVGWDGDDDPMSPRSMGIARKWLIVLILSASSLCVYVYLSIASLKDTTLRLRAAP